MSLVIFTISPAYVVCRKFGGHRENESKRSRRCLDGFVSYNCPYWLWHVVWSMSQVFFPPSNSGHNSIWAERLGETQTMRSSMSCKVDERRNSAYASYLENNIIVNECVASLFSCSFAHAVVDNLYLCLEHSPRLWRLRRNFAVGKRVGKFIVKFRVPVCARTEAGGTSVCMYDGTGEGAHAICVSITPLWKAVRTSSSQ